MKDMTSLGLPMQDVVESQNTAWTFHVPGMLAANDVERGRAPVTDVVVELSVGSVTTKSTLTMEESVDVAVAVTRVFSGTPEPEQGESVRV